MSGRRLGRSASSAATRSSMRARHHRNGGLVGGGQARRGPSRKGRRTVSREVAAAGAAAASAAAGAPAGLKRIAQELRRSAGSSSEFPLLSAVKKGWIRERRRAATKRKIKVAIVTLRASPPPFPRSQPAFRPCREALRPPARRQRHQPRKALMWKTSSASARAASGSRCSRIRPRASNSAAVDAGEQAAFERRRQAVAAAAAAPGCRGWFRSARRANSTRRPRRPRESGPAPLRSGRGGWSCGKGRRRCRRPARNRAARSRSGRPPPHGIRRWPRPGRRRPPPAGGAPGSGPRGKPGAAAASAAATASGSQVKPK